MTRRGLPTLFALLLALATMTAQAAGLEPYDGPKLPDFALADLDGNEHRLSEYQGQVVLVNFWATWCPPCVEELPSMQRLYDEFEDEPFTILAVDMDEEVESVRAFLDKLETEVTFPILIDEGGRIMGAWNIAAFPTSFVIGPDGMIEYALYGGLEWDRPEVVEKIEGLLPE